MQSEALPRVDIKGADVVVVAFVHGTCREESAKTGKMNGGKVRPTIG